MKQNTLQDSSNRRAKMSLAYQQEVGEWAASRASRRRFTAETKRVLVAPDPLDASGNPILGLKCDSCLFLRIKC